MTPIHTNELFRAFGELGLACRRHRSELVTNVSELCHELGWMLQDLPIELIVPDPEGKVEMGFRMQPAIAFQKRVILVQNSKVLIFGDDGGGNLLFVSELHQGKVGLVFEVPEDILMTDFENTEGILFWKEEFLEWLRDFGKDGNKYLDKPFDDVH